MAINWYKPGCIHFVKVSSKLKSQFLLVVVFPLKLCSLRSIFSSLISLNILTSTILLTSKEAEVFH